MIKSVRSRQRMLIHMLLWTVIICYCKQNNAIIAVWDQKDWFGRQKHQSFYFRQHAKLARTFWTTSSCEVVFFFFFNFSFLTACVLIAGDAALLLSGVRVHLLRLHQRRVSGNIWVYSQMWKWGQTSDCFGHVMTWCSGISLELQNRFIVQRSMQLSSEARRHLANTGLEKKISLTLRANVNQTNKQSSISSVD